jgi:DtxR family manganese transport transcriptional regulator
MSRLTREGLVTRQRYRSIFLTDSGRSMAEEARDRHRLVRDFLQKLGIDPETAEIDAEGIEHHTSEKTLAAFRRFLEQ